MRSLLLALACLIPLVAAQNVLAIAPVPAAESAQVLETAMVEAVVSSGSLAAEPRFADAEPPVGSTALLVAGLAGLTIAGGRREDALRKVVA